MCCLLVASMRSTGASLLLLLIAALCALRVVDAYRLDTFPRTPSTSGRSRFASPRHHHDSSCPTSPRCSKRQQPDKVDNTTARRTQHTIATRTAAALAKPRRKSGMAMSVVTECLDYAWERPRLVAGALCTAAATASFLSRCGDLQRRFKASFMVSSSLS
ncbi:unnamed protein product [Laminaria digitata]